MARFVWIPEAPNHPGLYANESDIHGRRYGGELELSTVNPYRAKQFLTKQECQDWCEKNPQPVFVPKEHGFDV